jgi:hypothetical protein
MAKESGFLRLMLICASALIAGILVALLLRALLSDSGPLPLVLGIGSGVVITIPGIATYFKRRM